MPHSRIVGLGSYVPEKVVSNADLERTLDTSDAWIRERTGIQRRRMVAEGQAASDLAARASRAALASCGLQPTDLDLIVVATFTPDMPLPSCAALVQRELGVPTIPVFDLAAACAGFIYGLSVADSFIGAKSAKRVLVIGVEVMSKVVNWTDRSTAILFGDGAGAAIVEHREAAPGREILAIKIYSDGAAGADHIDMPAGGSRTELTPELIAAKQNKLRMKGTVVFHAAVKNMVAASRAVLEEAGYTVADVDHLVAHQANLRILDAVAERLGVPGEKCAVNLTDYGNTSSASVPLALDEAERAGKIKPGQLVLLTALGAGFAWGAALVRW